MPNAIDICSTGGSGLPRINTSTLTAFILAALDVEIAKHGNRAASGRFGSFDFLESIGINITPSNEHLHFLFFKTNLAFCFAPDFHSVVGSFSAARKKVGFPTSFNLIGPLLNPANVEKQLIGVSYKECMETVLKTAIGQGKKHVVVVRGQDGLDEITITGKTDILE
ncbi:UNVERIFIED_CONTAM: hypothetical protein GTU68_005778, partial [Idotea baltica]|nr:hypothetical protein [Idotea baltica]